MPKAEEIEIVCKGMYGDNWDSKDPLKRPGDKMKDVWRNLAQRGLEALEKSKSA